MDSEERHELKENDLAEILRNFGDWFNEHGTKVLIAIIIVAATFTGYNFYTTSVQQRHDNAWTDLGNAIAPEDYLQVARSYDEPTVQTLAYLRGGDLFRRRAIGRYEPLALVNEGLEALETPEDPSPEADLEQAAAMYQRVLELNPEHTPAIYRTNALIGLGAVAESRRAWDQAREHYQQAIELGGEELPRLTRQAQRRLDLLDDLRQPIVFGPEPEPGEGPFDFMQAIPDIEGLEDFDIPLPEGFGVPPTEHDEPEIHTPEDDLSQVDDAQVKQPNDRQVSPEPEAQPQPAGADDAGADDADGADDDAAEED